MIDRSKWAVPALLLSCVVLHAPRGESQCIFPESSRVMASDAGADDFFGWSVDADADWIVSGVPRGGGQGKVYLYDRGAGLTETTLLPPDPAHVQFGWKVVLDGSWLFVGDPAFDGDRGRVDVYWYDGVDWLAQEAKVGGTPGDRFGWALDYDSGTRTLVVGAPGQDGKGRAHIYQRVAGSFAYQTSLFDFVGVLGDTFGFDLAVEAGKLAVGVPTRDGGRGEVITYKGSGDTWVVVRRLAHPDLLADDNMGYSVSMSGRTLVAGAPGHDALAAGAGAVFVYGAVNGDWKSIAKLLAVDGEADDQLGFSATVEGNVIAAGAPGSDFLSSAQGSVYQWRQRSGDWLPLQRLADHQLTDEVYLGWSVAISGAELFAGSPGRDVGGEQSAGAIDLQDVPAFALDVDPEEGFPGEHMHINHCGGSPLGPVGLFVVNVDGMPFFFKLLLGSFDPMGSLHLFGLYDDPALAGVVVELQSFAINPSSQIEVSNVVVLPLN